MQQARGVSANAACCTNCDDRLRMRVITHEADDNGLVDLALAYQLLRGEWLLTAGSLISKKADGNA